MPTILPKSDKIRSASAKVVMHQFARSEVKNLNKNLAGIDDSVMDLLSSMPPFAKFDRRLLRYLLNRAKNHLQSSDLTININALSWFSTPNEFNSYTQMYERGAFRARNADGSGSLAMPPDKPNTFNPVQIRDQADTRVTFGPRGSNDSGIDRFMMTGGVTPARDRKGHDYFRIENYQFNPKARQIFAALNYGRRPSGSSVFYGKSHLILREGLKRNSIYYMGDTFNLGFQHRLSFETIAGTFLSAAPPVLAELIDSCFREVVQRDTSHPHYLLEAHVFEPIIFRNDVAGIVIDASETNDDVRKNVMTFAMKHNIQNVRYSAVGQPLPVAASPPAPSPPAIQHLNKGTSNDSFLERINI